MVDGVVISGPSHPLMLECIASGPELVVFPESSKEVSFAADPNKPTAVDFCKVVLCVSDCITGDLPSHDSNNPKS
jgi:hypothetical protein